MKKCMAKIKEGINMKIGELLVREGLITQNQLDKALAKQKETGERISKILVASGAVDERKFLEFFAKQMQIPLINLANYKLDRSLASNLSENCARSLHALLLKEEKDFYLVAMADPQDIFAIDELCRVLRKPIKPALVAERALMHSIDLVYRHAEEIHGFAEKLATELESSKLEKDEINIETNTAILKLINSLFEDAVQVSASDIHIEPDENIVRIRMRVDGFLQEQIIEGRNIAPALSQRLKLLAGLNIAEKRLPQDGRFNITVRNVPIDVRLSTMPIQHGESIVMRLLNQVSGLLNLDAVGMPKEMLVNFRKLIKRPKGMILVTGPTGSGKTTTLYAALNEINDVSRKFITIEDPVEYRLSRINQVQVNHQLDLTFARVLRTALRQDPDIILVGEIRDRETATIALRAALTGHLVLATLHTNDAASTAIRLMDMGVEGYLIAATMNAALAQRLVRCVCKNCCEPYQPSHEEESFFAELFGKDFYNQKFYCGRGCEHCNYVGYQGRTGVFELLEIDKDKRDILRLNDASKFMKLVDQEKHTSSLLSNAYSLACNGITTLSEVMRVAGE
jgi:MSHA biogenesis protein MshE